MFGGLRIATSAMTAQRISMDVSAQNIANAETTHTAEGGPYQRRIAELEAVLPGATSGAMGGFGHYALQASADVTGGVRIAGIRTDRSPGPMIYDPANPDADRNGYVRMPNVDMVEELMAFKESGDAFQANATLFQAISSMLRKAVKI